MDKQIMIPIDESLKRVILRSLQMYRDELLISDWKINKPLYHAIVYEEVKLIEHLRSAINEKWGEVIISETFSHINQPIKLKQVKDTLQQLKKNPTNIVRGFTMNQQLVEVRYKEKEGYFYIMVEGESVCQVKNIDLVSSLFISRINQKGGQM